MEIGVGLDRTLGVSLAEEAELSAEAARLGYESVWTPEGTAYDAFQLCQQRWNATTDLVEGGLGTGISVSPVSIRTPVGLAMSAGTLSALTGGRFTLGVGTGSIHSPRGRRQMALPKASALGVMRDYVTVVRALLAGEKVTYKSPVFEVNDLSLGVDRPPRTPVLLGALGPRMLGLAGEVADGVSLNWCSAEQVLWSREVASEGARAAGRDPSEIAVAQYIRMCVDEDAAAARLAFAGAMLGYALGRQGASERERSFGYRAHFERMGYTEVLAEVDRMRDRGASGDEMAAAVPDEMLLKVGYFGTAEGAAEAFHKLSRGLDVAIVRVVNARPGAEAVLGTMRACRPDLVRRYS